MRDDSEFPFFPSLAQRGLSPAELTNILKELGAVGAAWEQLSKTLLTGGRLTGRTRELVILRVAFLRRCHYIWGGHLLIAEDEGLTFPVKPTMADAVVVGATDQLLMGGRLDEATRLELAAVLSPTQLVELTIVVSQYLSVSMITNVRGLGRQAEAPALPDLWPGPAPAEMDGANGRR